MKKIKTKKELISILKSMILNKVSFKEVAKSIKEKELPEEIIYIEEDYLPSVEDEKPKKAKAKKLKVSKPAKSIPLGKKKTVSKKKPASKKKK